MKKLNNLFTNIKKANNELFLNTEKITIIGRNKVLIQNYDEIIEIQDELVQLKNLTIKGKNLKIHTISKYFLEVTGTIEDLQLGGN